MWVPSARIQDELDLLKSMLVGMAVRTMGTIRRGLQGSIILLFPAVDIFAAHVVSDRRFCHSVFFCVENYCLPETHFQCYCIHGE